MTELKSGSLAIVIPSYRRTSILLQTIDQLLDQRVQADQILVIDQTDYDHENPLLADLLQLDAEQRIVFHQQSVPSIPAAMNFGLLHAQADYVLFLDDDIRVDAEFISTHHQALNKNLQGNESVVAQVGQVLQPGQSATDKLPDSTAKNGLRHDLDFPFNFSKDHRVHNVMAGNLCVHRETAIAAGGFDENFIGSAYRFETEFSRRLIRHCGQPVFYVPQASIDHLQFASGGTRSAGDFLASSSAAHSMGDYYFALLEGWQRGDRVAALGYIVRRWFGSVVARYYLRRPWHILSRLLGETRGLIQAIGATRRAQKLLQPPGDERNTIRVAVVISHAIQHFVPVYQALTREQDIELKVYFVAENGLREYYDKDFDQKVSWDIPLFSGYAHSFLRPGRTLDRFDFLDVDSAAINPELQQFAPDVICLNGYSHRINWRVMLARQRSARIVYTSDSNLSVARPGWQRMLKHLPVKYFLSRCDHFLAVSDSNRAYLKYYGVASSAISDVPYPVDTTRLQAQARLLDQADGQRLRESLGIPADDLLVVFAGKFIEHKCPQDVVAALALLANRPVSALFLGSGPLEESIRTQIATAGLQHRAHLIGFVNQTELANYFNAADLMVFPSSKEPFGAVASEGLVFGLPLIAAKGIGAIGRAILPGQNAELFSAGNVAELAGKLELFLNEPDRLTEYGACSRRIAPLQDAGHYSHAIAEFARSTSRKKQNNGSI